MSKAASRRTRRPLTRRDYYSLLFLALAIVLAGPAILLLTLYAEHRDRPSLQWPKVRGVVMQCNEVYHGGRHAYYSVDITCTYLVNGRRFTTSQIALWNHDWHGQDTGGFAAVHPAHTPVDVYYDPQHPGNAVLVPGPDEAGNRRSISGGTIATVGGVLMVLLMRSKFAQVKAVIKASQARAPMARPAGLQHGFASYEPGCKRKLNVFPDREALDEYLGRDDGKPLQEWQPDDRIIDAAGREYRLIKPPGKKYYDLDPTGQTWGYEQLLEVAEADGKLLKKDPVALDRRLDDVPGEERMAVLLKSIDEMPMGPRWAITGLFLFLLLFFLAVMFGFGALFTWLQKFWH